MSLEFFQGLAWGLALAIWVACISFTLGYYSERIRKWVKRKLTREVF